MREKERNLRRERERERTAKTCIAARHFSTRIYFILFYYYDWEIDDDFFTCFPSTVLDSARRLPFFFPFSFVLFLFFFFWERDFYYYDYDHDYYCYGYGYIPI